MKGIAAALLALVAVTGRCQDLDHGPLYDRVALPVRWLSPYLQPFAGPFAYKVFGFTDPPRPMSHYELAAYAYATFCVSRNDSRLEEVMAYGWPPEGARSRAGRMELWKVHFGDLEYALSQLRPELESMGAWQDFERGRTTVRAAFRKQGVELQPMPMPSHFRDVPKDHWAALETYELENLRVLNGYPDSRFRG